ncbi:MAG: hypothetical protein OXG72_17135, partial [Acidobacteria bacterium]|nr:hypothetical protein [Acidobacteriota bacterium]
VNLEDRLGKVGRGSPDRQGRRPRILRHVAKEVKHDRFYDLDVLKVPSIPGRSSDGLGPDSR